MASLPSLGRRGEGWVVLQVATLGLVVIAGRFLPGPRTGQLHAVAFIVGVAVMVAGAVLATFAVTELRRSDAFTAVPRPRTEGHLVETGPYRYVRHPVYSGMLLGSLGWAVARLSWPALLAIVVLAVVLDLKRRREEAWLVDRYAGYAAYLQRTRALFPFIY
jgi:protein-S-isoprenylcysteine O-methyltransferase Ste14